MADYEPVPCRICADFHAPNMCPPAPDDWDPVSVQQPMQDCPVDVFY
ncbi:hypothetical protein EDD29_0079 [Actinocorallia herbida]|uniref:Uncharacterized protein n=1 Tax=Actinocorallia herbida TaxID=58109 RepID=A0A3N1CPE3_9ACTN|nr:hypothetical protein [Actinocorallia herbida]ROO82598.1 hypothetical protein EDD29_0079 [Actinocorallia herbida]